MSEEYHMDEKQCIVWTRCWVILTDADLLGHQARLRTEPNFQPGFCQLIDTSEVAEMTLTGAAVKQVASNSLFARESKRPFVVVKNAVYGMGRMFELYQGLKGAQRPGFPRPSRGAGLAGRERRAGREQVTDRASRCLPPVRSSPPKRLLSYWHPPGACARVCSE